MASWLPSGVKPVTELEIYELALKRIVGLGNLSLERYVAKADSIACEALAKGEEARQANLDHQRKAA